ncbi:hypothetical protein ABW365_14315 [Enterococcus avium]
MISEKQKLAIVALAVLLVGEVIAVISIGLIYFNRAFFGEHINVIRTFVNASTAFFGCFFFIFSSAIDVPILEISGKAEGSASNNAIVYEAEKGISK